MSAALIQVILLFIGLLIFLFVAIVFFGILMVLRAMEDHLERISRQKETIISKIEEKNTKEED